MEEDMLGNMEIVDRLNVLLRSELTAVNQYSVHASMAGIWGYGKLDDYVMGRAKEEMGHAEKLIERILFLEGQPIVGTLDPVMIGATVPMQLQNDRTAEKTAITTYNEVVRLCANNDDNGTREILEDILTDEERHIREIEEKLYNIDQMGIDNFLSGMM
jgi:bacterioferritin